MSSITTIDILYYEPRDFVRSRGSSFDTERWVKKRGQGDSNIYYPPSPDDYIHVCRFNSIHELKESLEAAGFDDVQRLSNIVNKPVTINFIRSLLDTIFMALNGNFDRTLLMSCRATTSHVKGGKKMGVRKMEINDIASMIIDGAKRFFIVKEDRGFVELPENWENSFDASNPVPHDVVSQCQDVSEQDRGDIAWATFVYQQWKRLPMDMLKFRLNHDPPYTKDEVTSVADFVFADIKPNVCLSTDDEKLIRRLLQKVADGYYLG